MTTGYLLKARVSEPLAEQVSERVESLGTTLADFLRDALAYYLLAFHEADQGYTPAFIDAETEETVSYTHLTLPTN